MRCVGVVLTERFECTRTHCGYSCNFFSEYIFCYFNSSICFQSNLRTVGTSRGVQFVAGSSLASDKIKPLAAFSIVSRPSELLGLKAKPDRSGVILPMRVGEIESLFRTTSLIPAGESFCNSCSDGSPRKNILSFSLLFLFLPRSAVHV